MLFPVSLRAGPGGELNTYKKKYRTEVSRADFSLTSGIRLTLHGCDVKTLVSMIKEMEGSLC